MSTESSDDNRRTQQYHENLVAAFENGSEKELEDSGGGEQNEFARKQDEIIDRVTDRIVEYIDAKMENQEERIANRVIEKLDENDGSDTSGSGETDVLEEAEQTARLEEMREKQRLRDKQMDLLDELMGDDDG